MQICRSPIGDGAIGIGINVGPEGWEEMIQIKNEVYVGSDGTSSNNKPILLRSRAMIFPSGSPYLENLYITGGIESLRQVNGQLAYTVGAGISFDDDDIRMLLALR